MKNHLLLPLKGAFGVCAMLGLLTSCGSDDDNTIQPVPPEFTGQAPAGPNYFALNGRLLTLANGRSTGTWTYTTPESDYDYEFNDDNMLVCVTGKFSGNRNPIVYGEDKIVISHADGAEGVFEYFLEDGLITQCNKNGKVMYKWEYDSNKRVIRAVSMLTGGGVANSYVARWTATGDLAEVVCEEVSDYEAGRENFGDRWEFAYNSSTVSNPIVLKMPLRQPAAQTVLSLKLNPFLLAEGYFGNSAPRHQITRISEYDASVSTTAPNKVTDFRFTSNELGQTVRGELMYTNGVNATSYYYGDCQEYTWSAK